jgi:hypothetical protein
MPAACGAYLVQRGDDGRILKTRVEPRRLDETFGRQATLGTRRSRPTFW